MSLITLTLPSRNVSAVIDSIEMMISIAIEHRYFSVSEDLATIKNQFQNALDASEQEKHDDISESCRQDAEIDALSEQKQ